MRFFFLFLSFFAGISWSLPAQNNYTVSGYVRVDNSGETLIGAAIAVPALGKGTYTNEYGYYSLTLPAGKDTITLVYTFVGYARVERNVVLNRDISLDVELGEPETTLEEVEIVADSYRDQLQSSEMSVTRLSMVEARKVPALFGEVDIIKTLQLKPGISSGGEGSSGIFVRGGGPDQNLVLLDETVVYNPSHLFGFFSTFNSDAVKDVKLYKAGFPARYGGRLSSVIDVHLNEGNKRRFSGTGGLGLIASRLTLEGPIVKDKSSFIVSGRRTYVDIFTRLINRSQRDNADFDPIPDYYFYDLNGKVNYSLGDKDQLFLSGYLGRDAFNFQDDEINFQFRWGNTNANLRWNHLFGPRMFLNTTVSYTDYRYTLANTFDIFSFELGSRITDQSITSDLTFLPNDRHSIRVGAMATYHRFVVGRLEAGSSDSTFAFNAGNTYFGTEVGVYASDDLKLGERINLHAGLRLSGFISDSTSYWNLEPRLALRVGLNDRVSLKASYARMAQYLHLVSSSGATLPTDVWYPSNRVVQPQLSQQVAAGVSLLLWGERFMITNEVYYKWLDNQIDFRDGANLFVNDDLDSEFIFGRGWSYGNELYIEKKKGRLTGWVGYTLSWNWREFDGTWRTGEYIREDAINEGAVFPARTDRRHDLTVVSIFQLSDRFSLSATWEYRTGTAATLPIGRYPVFGTGEDLARDVNIIPIFGERNSFRLPAYHRLDLGLVWELRPKWGESDLTFSVYNAYNRRNAYFIYFDEVRNENDVITGFEARQVALFPAIPSITWNFKF